MNEYPYSRYFLYRMSASSGQIERIDVFDSVIGVDSYMSNFYLDKAQVGERFWITHKVDGRVTRNYVVEQGAKHLRVL